MSRRSTVAEASDVIRTPLDKVLDLVMAVRPGRVGRDNLWLLADGVREFVLSGGPERFDAHSGGQHLLYIDVDRARRTIGVQGHWWYRGEYSFDPDNAGTRVTYRVLNVAPHLRWAVPLANRLFVGYSDSVRRAVTGLARKIEENG
ncbi:SRPBCC family protein [Sphaerisporangium corydalis]|uniref:SRPBCC family protein n=1 Tax=Sphaerisporangium corydalis TaxID=1441875 RepID=A0ABV9E733_9ACTN|nr:hypothetical protein [Sphaerisporangium corydalis]